ncbi:MAG: hypothetical protein AAGJ10_03220, partial [Bacteroidota bacterium]
WFWFVQVQSAKAEGARLRSDASAIKRPCETNDILKIVDRLYRQRRLMRDHLKVLHHYGVRMMAPDKRRVKEMRAFDLWQEAMGRIEPILIRKGIVCNENRFLNSQPRNDSTWAYDALVYQNAS